MTKTNVCLPIPQEGIKSLAVVQKLKPAVCLILIAQRNRQQGETSLLVFFCVFRLILDIYPSSPAPPP